MKTLVRAMVVSLSIAGLTSCATTDETPIEESTPKEVVETPVEQTVAAPVVEEASTSGIAAGATYARNAINDPVSPLNQKIIYFEFDQSSVLPEYVEVVNNHARYLFDYTDIKVRLEGHADERGTREYNIALGERRAVAVRQLLLLQGVSANQINIISYGEELPAALAHDEESWGLNRRVELVYEGQ